MLRAVSSSSNAGGGKVRRSGRGAGNGRGNGGSALPPMNDVDLILMMQGGGPNGIPLIYDSSLNDYSENNSSFATDRPIYSTARKKFATSSIKLGIDTVTGLASMAYFPQVQLDYNSIGTGDFGIQTWFNWEDLGNTYSIIWDARSAGGDSSPVVYYDSTTGKLTYVAGGVVVLESDTSITENTWVFIEVSRVSEVVKMFINGVLVGTAADSTSISTFWARFGAHVVLATNTDAVYLEDTRLFTTGGNTAAYQIPTAALEPPFNQTVSTFSNKAATVTLLNNNRAAYASANFGCAMGSQGRSSGVWQAEFILGETFDLPYQSLCGMGLSSASLTDYPGAVATSYGYYSANGNKYNNNSGAAYGGAWDNEDVVGMVWDADAGELSFYVNGVDQGVAFSGLSGEYFPMFGSGNNAAGLRSIRMNTGQVPFKYPVVGATAWG